MQITLKFAGNTQRCCAVAGENLHNFTLWLPHFIILMITNRSTKKQHKKTTAFMNPNSIKLYDSFGHERHICSHSLSRWSNVGKHRMHICFNEISGADDLWRSEEIWRRRK